MSDSTAAAPPPAGPLKSRRKLRAALWLALPVTFGLLGGLGGYTFMYAQGGSYLGSSSQMCANCHIMQDHFDAWERSPHHNVAGCNDCHAPHDAFFYKWYVKGVNGFNHSLAFTTGNHPDPMRITDFNKAVTESACRHCHADIVHQIDFTSADGDSLSCIRCHSETGHIE